MEFIYTAEWVVHTVHRLLLLLYQLGQTKQEPLSSGWTEAATNQPTHEAT